MAKKKRKRGKKFKSGDKVIWFRGSGFDPREPVIAWVPSERWHKAVTRQQVRVTRHEKDVEDGRGQPVSQNAVYPWDDALWAACAEWLDNKAKLYADLNVLTRGKVPPDYLQEFTPTLWSDDGN